MTLLHARPGALSRTALPGLAVLLSFTLFATAGNTCAAQQQANNVQGDKPGKAERKASWPTFMLLAGEAGKVHEVELGIDAKHIKELAEKYRPNETARIRAFKQTVSELGEGSKKVQSFYLSKFPVTNEQFLVYVKATGARFPFHWWKDGEPEHYRESRDIAIKAFPDLPRDQRQNSRLFYWEQFWKSKKLPYKVPKGTEKHPVTFVNQRDALRFAAWAGMRLPTEVEWMLAATGGERKTFIFGDEYNREIAKKMNMAAGTEQVLKPVGSMGQIAQGPFGHQDMVGGVWEWCQDMGYEPVVDRKKNEKEFNSLKKDRVYGERLRGVPPGFSSSKCIVKGGSFLSFLYNDPIQLRPSMRLGLVQEETQGSVGFRLAKSQRPAYDMSMARLRYERPRDLPGSVRTNIDNQVGLEAYTLLNGGELIQDYNALSVVPMSHLTLDKNRSLKNLREAAKTEPLPICVVISTRDYKSPQLPAGLYTVYLRYPGITRDLQKALETAKKEFGKREQARKLAEKKGKLKEFTFKLKDGPWQQMIRRHGYSEKEILENTLSKLSSFIYVKHSGSSMPQDTKPEEMLFKVSTEKPQLLFRTVEGKWLQAVDTKTRFEKTESYDGTPSGLVADPTGTKFDVSFHVATTAKEKEKKRGKVVPFQFQLELQKPVK